MKVKKIFFVPLLCLAFSFSSCDDVLESLTSDETVDALKEALSVGAKSAATKLGEEDGYFADPLVKIALPEDAQTVLELANTSAGKTILSAAGVDISIEKALDTLINRAAEQAAPQSVEIFASAITGMSIADGEEILFGSDDAATVYLKSSTYSNLQVEFNPIVEATFSTVSFQGKDLNAIWTSFTKVYNKVLTYKNSDIGKLALVTLQFTESDLYTKINALDEIDTNLANYVTTKALDGLFVKVAEKELDIRENVEARTSSLLQRVFGKLDE